MKGPSASVRARAAWGDALPDWVHTLAEECDRAGQRQTAKRLKLSPAMVSLAVNNKREQLEFIKERVERDLMATIIVCPVKGVCGRAQCLREQSAEYTGANPLAIQLYRACRSGCPHYRGSDER